MAGHWWEAESPRWAQWVLLAFLATILLCLLSSIWGHTASRELARRTACMANLHSIYRAALAYKDEHGRYADTLEALREEGLLEKGQLSCPAGDDLGLGHEARYVYHPEAWYQTGEPVVTESPENHTSYERAFFLVKLVSPSVEPARYILLPSGKVENVAPQRTQE